MEVVEECNRLQLVSPAKRIGLIAANAVQGEKIGNLNIPTV